MFKTFPCLSRRWFLFPGCWLAASLSLGQIFYVCGTAGNDTLHDGLSPAPEGESGPFRTIGRAVASLGPGAEVRVRGGHYRESVFVRIMAAEDQETTVRAFENEVVTMTPASFSAFYISESAWVTLEGITFVDATGVSPVTLVDSESLSVRNCTFSGGGGAPALFAQNVADLSVTGCAFLENQRLATYFLNSGGNFEGNSLERNRGGSAFTAEGPGTAGLRVAGNHFIDNYPVPLAGHSVLFVLNGGAGIVIENNRVENSALPLPAGQAVPSGENVAGILAAHTDGITLRNNEVTNLQYPGTVDLSFDNPQYVLPAAGGGLVGNGIQVNGAGTETVKGGLVLQNHVWDCAGRGINLASVDDMVVAKNVVEGNGTYGIFLGGLAGNRTHVTGNVIEGNRTFENGWLHGGMSGIALWQAGRGNVVRRNLSYRNRQGTAGNTGYDWYADGHGIIADIDSAGTIIENNICFDNEGAGVAIIESADCVVVNNTLVGNGRCPHWTERPGLLIGSMDAAYHSQGTVVVNNIMYNNRLHQFGVYAFTSFQHTVHHNLYASGPLTTAGTVNAPIQWQGPKSLADWRAMWPSHPNGTGEIGSPPVFHGDFPPLGSSAFALLDSSPGVGAGISLASLVQDTGFLIEYDIGGSKRDPNHPNLGAVENFPGGFSGIESIRIESPFPSQWVAVNVWDYGAEAWVLPEHRNVFDLASLEVRGLAGGRWYGISIWSYNEARWDGVFVSLLDGTAFSAQAPEVLPQTGTSGSVQGILGVDELRVLSANTEGSGWLAPGLWSDLRQAWEFPLTTTWEPREMTVPSLGLNDWYWAGMWNYAGDRWTGGSSWIGIFRY